MTNLSLDSVLKFKYSWPSLLDNIKLPELLSHVSFYFTFYLNDRDSFLLFETKWLVRPELGKIGWTCAAAEKVPS